MCLVIHIYIFFTRNMHLLSCECVQNLTCEISWVYLFYFRKCVAGWFRAFNSDLHWVGEEQGEGDQNCGRGTSHCQSCIKKHPPSHRLGCPRQQCVYNADCTEMGSGGLWGSSNCITTNSTKVKPKLHKAPFILSFAQPISSHCFPAQHWPSLGFLFKTIFIFRLMWTVCLHNMFHSCNILLRELTCFSTQEEVSFYSWDDVNMLQIKVCKLIQRHWLCQNTQNRCQMEVFPITDLLLCTILSSGLAWKVSSFRRWSSSVSGSGLSQPTSEVTKAEEVWGLVSRLWDIN